MPDPSLGPEQPQPCKPPLRRQRCPPAPRAAALPRRCARHPHTKGHICDTGMWCVPTANPNSGITSFDSILWAWLTIFQVCAAPTHSLPVPCGQVLRTGGIVRIPRGTCSLPLTRAGIDNPLIERWGFLIGPDSGWDWVCAACPQGTYRLGCRCCMPLAGAVRGACRARPCSAGSVAPGPALAPRPCMPPRSGIPSLPRITARRRPRAGPLAAHCGWGRPDCGPSLCPSRSASH